MKSIYYLASAVLSCLTLITACDSGFRTRTFEENGKFALKEGAADSITVALCAEYPEKGMPAEALAKMNRTLNSELFGDEYADSGAKAAMAGYRDKAVSEYRETNLPFLEELQDEGLSSASLNWEIHISGEISGFHNDIISYIQTGYSFTGGAHGISDRKALNFCRKTGNVMTESDLFTEGYEQQLGTLLTAHLPEAFEDADSAKMLFVSEISTNGNFLVSEKGITYIYNQYEIGPYAMGIIEVTVPWEEVKEIMRK